MWEVGGPLDRNFSRVERPYSLLIDRDLCENRKVSIKFPCSLLVYLCLSSGDLFIFSIRVYPFYSYFLNASKKVPK